MSEDELSRSKTIIGAFPSHDSDDCTNWIRPTVQKLYVRVGERWSTRPACLDAAYWLWDLLGVSSSTVVALSWVTTSCRSNLSCCGRAEGMPATGQFWYAYDLAVKTYVLYTCHAWPNASQWFCSCSFCTILTHVQSHAHNRMYFQASRQALLPKPNWCRNEHQVALPGILDLCTEVNSSNFYSL